MKLTKTIFTMIYPIQYIKNYLYFIIFTGNKKNSTWDEANAAYFKKLRGTGRKQFYEMLLKHNQPKQNLTVAENLNEVFTTQINLQKNIAEFQQFQRTSLEEDATTLRL